MDKFDKRQKMQKVMIIGISLVLIVTMFAGYFATSTAPTP